VHREQKEEEDRETDRCIKDSDQNCGGELYGYHLLFYSGLSAEKRITPNILQEFLGKLARRSQGGASREALASLIAASASTN
ncbi:MAG: hypothetical protein IT173_00195, partial [Acidobacteria bacterium]|nr:hypothetical protein [Acidobacteriota bacterium]